MIDAVTIRETYERPTAEFPQGSYLFRVGSRFIQATGRFSGLSEELGMESAQWLQLATLHRCVFLEFSRPVDWTWAVKPQATSLVKEGPKAMVVYGAS